jgi:hypothetical protein
MFLNCGGQDFCNGGRGCNASMWVQQVPGSNPGVPCEMLCCVPSRPTHEISEDVVDTFLVIIWNLFLQSHYEWLVFRWHFWRCVIPTKEQFVFHVTARLAQSAERKALKLVVVGSSLTVGVLPLPMHMLGCTASLAYNTNRFQQLGRWIHLRDKVRGRQQASSG